MISKKFDFQPTLQNDWIKVVPLDVRDFEKLYKVASDPLLWEQHPNKDRYKRDVFENFFKGALESKGAFTVYNRATGEVIGSSRFYDFDSKENSVAIGYTYLARDHWGTTYNKALKSLMLAHALQFVDKVIFHIGACNIRSQKAIKKLGAIKIGEIEMKYYGEETKLNFIYQIDRSLVRSSYKLKR